MKYRRVISIGSFCGTALALQRFDLRDASYPFDWVLCRLEHVLALFDNGFEGFLEDAGTLSLEHLPHAVILDSRSGIQFLHDFDFELPIEAQLQQVREKFKRRIRRLLEAPGPILFVRHLRNEEEFDYLDSNMQQVLAVLRKRDARNGLFLIGNPVLVPQLSATTRCGGMEVVVVEVPRSDAANFGRYNLPNLRRALRRIKYPVLLRVRNSARRLLPLLRDRLKQTFRPMLCSVLGEGRLHAIMRTLAREPENT